MAHFIPSRSNRSCLPVIIIDDFVLEEEEEIFRAMIHRASGGVQILEPSDATIVIIDNDGNVVLDGNPMPTSPMHVHVCKSSALMFLVVWYVFL